MSSWKPCVEVGAITIFTTVPLVLGLMFIMTGFDRVSFDKNFHNYHIETAEMLLNSSIRVVSNEPNFLVRVERGFRYNVMVDKREPSILPPKQLPDPPKYKVSINGTHVTIRLEKFCNDMDCCKTFVSNQNYNVTVFFACDYFGCPVSIIYAPWQKDGSWPNGYFLGYENSITSQFLLGAVLVLGSLSFFLAYIVKRRREFLLQRAKAILV